MWNRIKSLFGWIWNKLTFWKDREIKDPEKTWPYGHKLEGKVYYFPNRKQLGLESRMSRRFRGMKDK